MTSAIYLTTPHWRDLYRAALLETDKTKLPGRIADARMAIVARARALFETGDYGEGETLEDAMYILNALQGCVETVDHVAA